MLFDVRLPIGLLFLAIGLLVAGYGLLGPGHALGRASTSTWSGAR